MTAAPQGAGSDVEDRAYQSRALASTRASFASGKRAPLLVAPTGAGKTTIAAHIVAGAVAKGNRVAALGHRKELVDQMAARFRTFGLDVGVDGSRPKALVQIWKPQVILARRQMPEAELVIVDEAHHYVAHEWGQITAVYLKMGKRLVGLSATPERADGVGLGELFDDLIVVAQIKELTLAGFLVPCEVFQPTRSHKELALEPWEAFKRYSGCRPTVVFAASIKAAEAYAADFIAQGIDAVVVHGKLDEETRETRLAQFNAGRVNVLINVMVLTEGWDCPRAAVCILARLVGSPSLFLQMVGRVLRPAPGKPNAIVVDLCGNIKAHGLPDEERIWSLEGPACTLASRQVRDGVRFCRVCKTEMPPDVRLCPPPCGTPLPEQLIPRGQGIELERVKVEKEADKRARGDAATADRRIMMLAALYANGIRNGHKRDAARFIYKSKMGRFPDTKLMIAAWAQAQAILSSERANGEVIS